MVNQHAKWPKVTGHRKAAALHPEMVDKRAEHRAHVRRSGEDLPEIRDWAWTGTP